MVDREKMPEYKQEGFFIFSDLREGDYTLKITGERFQPITLKVVIPPQVVEPPHRPVLLAPRGDNELIVVVRAIADENGEKKITFDPVILTKEIRAGARVVSNILSPDPPATLAATLEVGEISSARLKDANALVVGAIVPIARIIRDESIRLNFDPYYSFASPITRVVGKVVSKQNPATPLAGAQVRVTRINDKAINSTDVRGVMVFTGQDISEKAIVLGTEKDISSLTNREGHYNLYFSNETLGSFKITDKTLDALKADGVPDKVINGLIKPESLKDKFFRRRESFLAAVREKIKEELKDVKEELRDRYIQLVLKHSENFIRKLTLEATLAGFKPATTEAVINTGERKPVDFQLDKA